MIAPILRVKNPIIGLTSALMLLLFMQVPAFAATGDITTVAGSGVTGGDSSGAFSGDGDLATLAEMYNPSSVTVDTAGNLYIVSNHRIRKVDAGTGVITTVAGNPTLHTDGVTWLGGFSGDSGPAVLAELNFPSDVAVDAAGNLYISDKYNHRIRKVDTLGDISTVAGTGVAGFSGDGGAATAAQLNFPSDLTVDSADNLYVSDSQNHRIRKVDTLGNITTIAGTGVVGFSGDGGVATAARLHDPRGLTVDTVGNLYIVDKGNDRIRKVDTLGNITTIAGSDVADFSGDGEAAISAQLSTPYGVSIDAAGNLYVADTNNHRIRKVDTLGDISTVAGTGVAGFSGDGGAAISAQIRSPKSVTVDVADNLYIVGNHRIRKVDTFGVITTIAGTGVAGFSGDGGVATAAQLNYISNAVTDVAGNLYISDKYNHRIRKIDTGTGNITTVAGNPTLHTDGVTWLGGFSGDGGPAASAELNFPSNLTVDTAGNLYIADTKNHRIRKVDTLGDITTIAGTGVAGFSGDGGAATAAQLYEPRGLAIDTVGNLYIADWRNYRIRKVDASGVITTIAGDGKWGFSGDVGLATEAKLSSPSDVTVDATGNLYITDSGSNRIRKVDISGVITTVAGNGRTGFASDGGLAAEAKLLSPSDVAIDTTGNLYISDSGSSRIRKVYTSGVITTVAGNGMAGFAGDGGLATAAQIHTPEGVAVDSSGNLYIADYYNRRIRMVESVDLLSSNNPPTPVADSASTDVDVAVITDDVLLNDSDPDNDVFTLVSVDAVSVNGGIVVDNGNNTFTYTPPSGFVGTDTFQYLIEDSNGAQSAGTVTVYVSATESVGIDGGGATGLWFLLLVCSLFLRNHNQRARLD